MSSNDDKLLDKCPDELNEAGYAPVCKSCSGQRLCQEMFNKVDTDIEDINVRMNVIKHKLLVLSGKGGVGKSTFATNLALILGKEGFKVGVLDFDICGPSIANLLGVQDQNIVSTPWGWKPLVSSHYDIKVMSVAALLANNENAVIYKGPRKTNLIKRMLKETFWGKLDFLVCDTPPGTSDEHLTIVRLLRQIKPDGALLLTTPQKLSMDAVRKEITFCRKTGVKILGIIENMSYFVCPCCEESYNIFPHVGIETIAKEHLVEYLGKIPIDQAVAECCEKGLNMFSPETKTSNLVKSSYDNILAKVQQTIIQK